EQGDRLRNQRRDVVGARGIGCGHASSGAMQTRKQQPLGHAFREAQRGTDAKVLQNCVTSEHSYAPNSMRGPRPALGTRNMAALRAFEQGRAAWLGTAR